MTCANDCNTQIHTHRETDKAVAIGVIADLLNNARVATIIVLELAIERWNHLSDRYLQSAGPTTARHIAEVHAV